MATWHLCHGAVAAGPVRLVVQRIATSHWSAVGTLRSWGIAPLHREDDMLLLPCAAGEALWIGAWLDDESSHAVVHVSDTVSGKCATVELPRDYQLSALSAEGEPLEPLTLPAGSERRVLKLEIICKEAHASIDLTLLTPTKWKALTGQVPPDPLEKPPPLPPLLG